MSLYGSFSHPSEGPRTLLVGSAASVAQLGHVLRLAEPSAAIVGCLLPPDEVEEHGAIGDFAQLEQTLTSRKVERVLIALPMSMIELTRSLSGRVQAQGIAWRFMPTFEDQLAGQAMALVQTDEEIDADVSEAAGAKASEEDASSPTLTLRDEQMLSDRRALRRPALTDPCAIDPVQLLDRHPAPLDEAVIRQTIENRVVLITGAGGSIGSEMARIVARFEPAKLVLVERSENALFEIDREIARLYPKQSRAAVLHDVTDGPRTLAMVMAQKPDVIFHAAAHKHVPMMEEHPSAAVENNFYGTRSIADAASQAGTDRFVMISTDKAVNPTSVMGATKRLAELYIQHLNSQSKTIFSMVRFGNVLGSACSVLPIWAKQLTQGDPLTVTHPDMLRYFMTIPEAAGLVLQSAAYSGRPKNSPEFRLQTPNAGQFIGGEVFLLDMGKPIRIVDMARRFILAQGLRPDIDVPIVFTGIRPGEKLYEELAYGSEGMLPTPHQSIRIWQTTPMAAHRMKQLIAMFDGLRAQRGPAEHHWQHASSEEIIQALREAVPEMKRPVDDLPLKASA